VFPGRVADAIVVDGFQAEGADQVVGQAVMRTGRATISRLMDVRSVRLGTGCVVVFAAVWADLRVMISMSISLPHFSGAARISVG
jgi:hypothetical protein